MTYRREHNVTSTHRMLLDGGGFPSTGAPASGGVNGASVSLSPTYAEMAARMRSKARSLQRKAERLGNTPKGRAALEEAASYARIAAGLSVNAAEAVAARDGMLTEYRKARADD